MQTERLEDLVSVDKEKKNVSSIPADNTMKRKEKKKRKINKYMDLAENAVEF